MILGIAFLWVAFYHINPLPFPKWLDFKPFNCIVCLSFWSVVFLSLIAHFIPSSEVFIHSLALGGFGAYLSIIVKRLIFKI
jgi:hypothetical protein